LFDIVTKFIIVAMFLNADIHEKNEMGGACDMYGGGEKCAQGSGGET
jgi:hypothetical protein